MFATHSLYAADVNSDDNQEIFSTEDSSTHRNARVIYVKADATGANDGTSWADAYTDLQDALAAATASDEIFVAADTYRPTDNGDRTVSFQLKNGVALYGGFNGNETTRDERDWDANSTILSGDLSGDDNENVAHDEPTRADNSYHVVRAISIDDTAKLDGFTITGGNGNVPDDGTNNDSGGMRNDSSSPTLSNLVFMNNSAIYGGGMSNLSGSSPTLVHVTFNNNVANAAGGMLNEHNSNPTLLHVIFTSNCTSIYHRVGMYNDNSYPILNHVTFTGHSTGGNGGGIYNNQSRPIITDATFTSNVAVDDGGGMYNYQSSPTVRNATFTGNSVSNDGGGMYNSESRAALSHVTFTGNSAHDGGGMFNNNSNPTVINGVFNNNSAPYGGGMYNIRRHSTVSNVTFTGDVLRENFLTSTIEIVSNNWHTNHTAFQAPGGGKLDAQTILDSVAERRGQVWWSVGCQTGPVMPNDSNGVTAVEIARSHNGGWEDYICRLKNYGLAMGEDELIRANPGSTSSWRAWAVASDLQIDCNSISQPDTTAPSWKKCGPSASSIASYLSNMDSGQNTNSVLLYMSPILVSILLGVMSSVVISDGQIILSLRSGK